MQLYAAALLQRATVGGRRGWQGVDTWSFFSSNGAASAAASLSAPFQWRRLGANVSLLWRRSKISRVWCSLWVCNHHVQRKPQHDCGLAPLQCAQKNDSQIPTQEAPEPCDSQRTQVLPTPSWGSNASSHFLRSTTTPSIQESLLPPLLPHSLLGFFL